MIIIVVANSEAKEVPNVALEGRISEEDGVGIIRGLGLLIVQGLVCFPGDFGTATCPCDWAGSLRMNVEVDFERWNWSAPGGGIARVCSLSTRHLVFSVVWKWGRGHFIGVGDGDGFVVVGAGFKKS